MVKIRFFIMEGDENTSQLYIVRYAVEQGGLVTTTHKDEAATFTRENNGWHRASVFQSIIGHVCSPQQIQLEVEDLSEEY